MDHLKHQDIITGEMGINQTDSKPAHTSIQNKPVCCLVRTKICLQNIKNVLLHLFVFLVGLSFGTDSRFVEIVFVTVLELESTGP